MKNCENIESCPIYLDNHELEIEKINTIKSIYCETDTGKLDCKRYLVFKKLNYCPVELKPDDSRSLDEILDEILDEEF